MKQHLRILRHNVYQRILQIILVYSVLRYNLMLLHKLRAMQNRGDPEDIFRAENPTNQKQKDRKRRNADD